MAKQSIRNLSFQKDCLNCKNDRLGQWLSGECAAGDEQKTARRGANMQLHHVL